ncbi:MAG: serine/threonine protein kinase, partial [Methanoregulaceae archaeon]|nr:serine/threonine protein kinase [Methanoregulaceae archaeon]
GNLTEGNVTIPPPGSLPAPSMVYVIPILATLGLVLSLDLMGTGSFRFDQPLKTRILVASGYFVCGIALLFALMWMVRTGITVNLTGLWPLYILLIALVAYVTLSTGVLILGSLSSRSLRLTLKTHWGLGVLILFIAILLFLAQPIRANYPLVMVIAAAPVSSLLARWQDHRMETGGPSVSGIYSLPGGGANGVSAPGEVTRVAGSTHQETFPLELADRYTNIQFIGLGGISRVFKATRICDGETIAIKIPIHFDDTAGKCFMKEIMSWEGLEHPNIVQIRGVNILPIPYVEMEYIRDTLQDLKKPVPVLQAVEIMTGVAEGLAYAHERGIIHRDIKPQNILITPEGLPKITDWGMSKVMGTCIIPTLTGFSLSYAAPEQVAPGRFGETDQRTDVYQLGTVFYELVTGKVLHPGDDLVAVSTEIISRLPEPPSTYNHEALLLDQIILKCLETDPNDRYQSVQALLHDLQRFRPGGSLTEDMFEEP